MILDGPATGPAVLTNCLVAVLIAILSVSSSRARRLRWAWCGRGWMEQSVEWEGVTTALGTRTGGSGKFIAQQLAADRSDSLAELDCAPLALQGEGEGCGSHDEVPSPKLSAHLSHPPRLGWRTLAAAMPKSVVENRLSEARHGPASTSTSFLILYPNLSPFPVNAPPLSPE